MSVTKTIQTPLGTYSFPFLVGTIIVIAYIFSVASSRISLYFQRRKFRLQHGCRPAKRFPLKDPILGSDQSLRRMKAAKEHRALKFAQATFQEHGNTWSSRMVGQAFISTIEPENVKTILSLRFEDFGIGNREGTLGKLLGRGIFTTDGPSWQHSRAMIRPNFTRTQVGDLHAFERHIQTLFKILPRDGSTVDLQDLFFMFTIDSATEFLFGQSTGSLNATQKGIPLDSASDFARAFNHAQESVAKRARMGLLKNFYKDPAGDRSIEICHEFVDQFVDEAVRYREKLDSAQGEVKEEKYVFLHELAKNTTDKKRLRDELLNVLLAGRDTTASLLSNMWFELAKRPDIIAKLKQEVDETLNGELPTYEQLKNMKYLKYCMNESLRTHPVVPGNSRIAYKDTVLPVGGGPDGKSPIFVSKGTIVAYWTYSMHRRRDLFGEDAEEFRPERWEKLRPGWEYLPFNGGPRICLGQSYALLEAGYVTARLLQEFKGVESRDPNGGIWIENLTLTLCSHHGTKISLTPA